MAMMLAVPLKNTAELDFVRPLKNFIKNTFGGEDGEDDYSNQLGELHKLRNNAVCRKLDKHNTSLEILARYYDQLEAVEDKLPISEGHVSMTFTWQDAFDKGSFFGGGRKQSGSNGSYEKVCVLFNIAAMNSQIAALQSTEDDVALKASAKQFQQAAGIFNHLNDSVLSAVQDIRTFDIHPDCLTALGGIMLAQAQEVFVRKAQQDKMKNAIIAKIAVAAAEEYASALSSLQVPHIKGIVPKDWIPTVGDKVSYMRGLAEYHQSLVCQANKKYGEEIARLQKSLEHLQKAVHKGDQYVNVKPALEKAQRALQLANKDNNFIYHDIIPSADALQLVGSSLIAKPLSVPKPMYPKFVDLFEKLVPLALHNALDAYEGRKVEIVSREVGKLRENTQLLNSVLASLNLPAAIEDMGGSSIPPSLLQKSNAVQEKGGILSIDKLFNEMPDLLKRNTEILNESIRLLDDEAKTDKEMKDRFKERWTRLPSDQLTTPLRAESAKYRTILNNAIQADGIVREKYEDNKEFIAILSKTPNEMTSDLPATSAAAALKESPVVQSLRKLMKEVESIKAEREVSEAELKNTKSDMTSKFLSALASDGAINEEEISNQDLDRLFSPLIQQVQDSMHRQEVLLNNVQDANTRFSQAKQSDTSVSNRDDVLRKLASAHDAYMELTANLTEGTKFYNDLTQLLVRFQGKVSDLCFARKTEKEELLRDLTQTIANQPSSPPPVTPAHHAQVFSNAPSGQPVSSGPPPPSQQEQSRRDPPLRPSQPPTRPQAPSPAQAPPPARAPPTAQAPIQAPPQPTQPNQPYPQSTQPPSYAPGYQPMPSYAPYGGFTPMPTPYNPYAAPSCPQQTQYGNPYQQQPGQYPPQQGGYPQQLGGYPQQPGQYPPQHGGYQQPSAPGYPYHQQ